MSAQLEEKIKTLIAAAVPEGEVHVQNINQDGQHFQALVISPAFVGMRLIEQHRMVMEALADALAADVHAVSIKTFTPEKWAVQRDRYL